MKKINSLFFAGIILLLASTLSACKTTPPAQTEPTVSAAVATAAVAVKPVDDALTALRDRMESLRNECLKYKLDAYKSQEWAVAEASRAAGLQAYGTDYDLAKKSFEEAIAQYEAIRKDGMVELNADLDASILAAREAAVKAGANEYFPLQFALADTTAEQCRTLRESGDSAAAYDAAQLAVMRYRTLEKEMRAIGLKQKIDRNKFEQYGAEEYAQAGVKYDEAVAAYGTTDAAAFDSASASVALYEKINNAGFKALSADEMTKAGDIRALCDSIKAKTSMKADYAAAAAKYTDAAGFASAENWEPAYTAYAESTVAFTGVYQEAVLKRNAADVAIAAAKDKQAASTELAVKADALAPLPENAEGFSDEPVVIENAVTGEETK